MKIEDQIKKFLKQKRALIFTTNSVDRAAWKGALHELGIPITHFANATTLIEAKEALAKKPEVFFIFHDSESRATGDLIKMHLQFCPDRSEALCFVCSDKNSLALASQVADQSIDALLLKPYTPQELKQLIKASFEEKVSLSRKEKMFYTIQALIEDQDFSMARTKLAEYLELSPESPYPYFLQGRLFEEKNSIDDAVEAYMKALEWDEKNYKVLTRLFDLHIGNNNFEQAYECGEVLSENYPLNPDRISGLIKASLGTENIKNLVDFCDMVLRIDDDISPVAKKIAAALAISASYLAADPKLRDLVIASARRAIKLTSYDSPIFVSCLETLLKVDDLLDVEKVLEKIPSDEMSDEICAVELQWIYLTSGPSKAFERGQNLIKMDKVTSDVFTYVIKSAKGIGKAPHQVEDIAHAAIKEFPEMKDYFLKIAN